MGAKRIQWWTLPEISHAKDFYAWLHGAERGDAIVYYRGHLWREYQPKTAATRAVGSTIRVQEEMGEDKIHPVQVRLEDNDYVYVAVRA
jgi:hypothetical protein